VAIRLPGGAGATAEVVRALDLAGVVATSLELNQPSLDDVFMAKTGRHLAAEEFVDPEAAERR
jgi:ABC-2 type transport system ATP-binding protein